MADFVWKGDVDGDIGNPKNWWDATADLSATRTPGQTPDNNDNIWFVKTTGVTTLTGSITGGINDCFWLAAAVSNYTIGSMTGNYGITGQWNVYSTLTVNDMVVGYDAAGGKAATYNGFAADRVTFHTESRITVNDDAYLLSGTYKGTLTAGDCVFGNSSVDSFVGTDGIFECVAGTSNRVWSASNSEEVKTIIISSTPMMVTIDNTSVSLTTASFTTSARQTNICNVLPITSAGTLSINGSELYMFTNSGLTTWKDFSLSGTQTLATISASPSQSIISTIACTRASFPTSTILSLGGYLDISTSAVQASAASSGSPTDYTVFMEGVITENTASTAKISSTNVDASKYLNLYLYGTTTAGVVNVAPAPNFDNGILNIVNTTKAELLGPLRIPLGGSTWTGELVADLRGHEFAGHFIRGALSGTALTLKYTGAGTCANTFMFDDVDTSIPLTLESTAKTNVVTKFKYSTGGTPYKFVDLTMIQNSKNTITATEVVEVSGNLVITGGTIDTAAIFQMDKLGACNVTCTAETITAPTLRIGVSSATATVCSYNWTSTSTEYPIINVRDTSTLKPVAAITGAHTLEGAGTFDWNGGLVATNHLFYITKSTGTPMSINNFLNPNFLSGYKTTFRFDVKVGSGYSITLPAAVSGDVELGSSGTPGIGTNNDPIYNCPAACVITGGLKIDYSEYANTAIYNAKVLVASASNELQVSGNTTIGSKGYCAAKIKVTDSDFVNSGTIVSSKISLISSVAGTYIGNVGTSCTLTDMLIDGQGLTSKHSISGSPTLTGTYTITDASVALADLSTTTTTNIVVTGASSCAPGHHLFVLNGGGTITDSSTETRTAAGVASFAGCDSLGTLKLSSGTTGIVGSVIVDSIILRGGIISQNQATAKKLWIRGGTHPTALVNDFPGYKGNTNFSQIAVNAKGGSFIFPTSGSNFNVLDTLIIGNANNAEVHFAGDSTLTLGHSLDANMTTNTVVKWNTSKGIGFGPSSTYTGSFSIQRCDIEGNIDMTEALVLPTRGNTYTTDKVLTVDKNYIHSTKQMSLLYVDNSEHFEVMCRYNRFSAKSASTIIKYGYSATDPGTASSSEIAYNHLRSLDTSGTIVELNNIYTDRAFFHSNILCSDTMTSGVGIRIGPGSTMLNPNTILVGSGVTPIDFSEHLVGGSATLTDWYFDETNSNFARSCQGRTVKSMTSQFTNGDVNNKYIVAGHKTDSDAVLVQHEDYTKWLQSVGSNPLVTIFHNSKNYRYSRAQSTTITSTEFYNGATGFTATWTEYDVANPIQVVANYWNGSSTSIQILTSGTAATVPATCIRLSITINLASSEGFTDFKLVDNMSRTFFTDMLSTGHATQSAARHEIGPMIGGRGYGGANTAAASVVPWVSNQYNDPINQSAWIYLRASALGGSVENRVFILLGEQDSDDWYRFTLHQQSSGSGNDILTIEKSVGGTITSLITKTDCNFTAGDAGKDLIMKATKNYDTNVLTLVIEGTTTTDWEYRVQATDTVFTSGSWGWAVDSGAGRDVIEKAQVYDGVATTQMFMNGMDLIFMPNSSWRFPTTITNVEMRDCTINGNQSTLMPQLYGTHTTTLNDVTFTQHILPTTITDFIVIKDSTLTLAGEVTISGKGKLHLIGCKINPATDRWKINYDGITYTDSSSLLLQGNLLTGMHTTITPSGEAMFIVDDSAKNTSVIRIQSDKTMNLTRNAVLGLDYERMVFNGFDSKTIAMTVQSVNDAGIIGKLEEMFMNQVLFELVTPYCHLWKAKIVQFTPRIMNTQVSALQAILTIEEWRDD